jgi:hypothetical protein
VLMFLAKNKVSSYFITFMCYYGELMIVPYYYSYLMSICYHLFAYVLFSGFIHMVIMLFLFFIYFH